MLRINVDITNMDIFKSIVRLLKCILDDEEIESKKRKHYSQKLDEIMEEEYATYGTQS